MLDLQLMTLRPMLETLAFLTSVMSLTDPIKRYFRISSSLTKLLDID